tara:strand:+ start:2331 stop:2522 length:192 start_codon:yes stop_codon:yes gene_type:complete
MKTKKAIKELNKQFNPKGIAFEDAGAGWERYKKSVKDRKFKDCKHPHRKQGCCDFCGKDLVGE